MADLIERRAAIEALGEQPIVWDDDDDFEIGKECQWKYDVAAIKELPSAQPEQHWISCSERLPEESGMYIVTAYDGTTERVTFVKYQKTLKRWDLTGARAYWRIFAWMPLPEAWKGEV